MIAYNKNWLKNILIREQVEEASTEQLITNEEEKNIFDTYEVGFYSPNPFVRIGLFILTAIVALFTVGLSLLFFSSVSGNEIGASLIFLGLLAYCALEVMVSKKHYKSGVDDALQWIAPICILTGFNAMANISMLTNSIYILIMGLFLFIRFINMFVAAVVAIALLAVVFLAFIKLGEIAKAIAPFIIMLISASIYFFVKKLENKEKYKLYNDGLLMISFIALLSLYVAGNYFVVREMSIAMFNIRLSDGETIPLGWLFWIFTFIIPVIYMVKGVQKKDSVLLRTGLLLTAAIVFTVRYYYHIIPLEIAAVIAGILLIGIAYLLINYLREPQYGFTYKKRNDPFFMNKLQVESIIIAETFGGNSQPIDTGTQFGGGSGGGAGATGEF